MKELDIYLNGNDDQPTYCRECGSRTDILSENEDQQHHKCPVCNYEFLLCFVLDLREKSEKFRHAAKNQFGLEKTNGIFKAGDIIEFFAGNNMDIRYRAEIAGLCNDEIFLIWDCYWSPIKNDSNRQIKPYKKAG